jgi:hypothetical protein
VKGLSLRRLPRRLTTGMLERRLRKVARALADQVPDLVRTPLRADMPFPFPGDRFPVELGAVVQCTVLSGQRPALEVTHTENNHWLVGDAVDDPNVDGACVLAHMSHVVERNSSVATLATLPVGHVAWRSKPGEEWAIAVHEWPDDDEGASG